MDDFAAFILTNGRPNNVKTYHTLKRSGYTGRIVILVDDLDPTLEQYKRRYGDEVVVFDKRAIAAKIDAGDNFEGMQAIVYARNAVFEVARELGIQYFIQLDDDYRAFKYRFDDKLVYANSTPYSSGLDIIFALLVQYFKSIPAHSIALSQGGDWIGGKDSPKAKKIYPLRKCMNSYICSIDRPFRFAGRMNEDVSTYTRFGSVGALFLTIMSLSVLQIASQKTSGGMSEVYLDSGTYVKTFYTVMYSPSCTKVSELPGRSGRRRIHHYVTWRNAVPVILREDIKK